MFGLHISTVMESKEDIFRTVFCHCSPSHVLHLCVLGASVPALSLNSRATGRACVHAGYIDTYMCTRMWVCYSELTTCGNSL